MRRIVALVLGLMLLVIPAVVGAQDSKLVFDLDATFTVTDLGFQFKYPKDWVADTSRGIRIAENDADLTAIVDTEESTQAEGYTISLNALTVDNLGMEPDAKLEDIVDTLVSIAGITETEGRVEVPVLSHRAITIIGTNSGNKPGLASIWLQDGYVVLFNMGAPMLNADVGYTWGNILGGITALDAMVMNKEPFAPKTAEITMRYPEGWFKDEASGTLAEIEADLTASGAPTGIAFSISKRTLETISPDAKDLATAMEATSEQLGWAADDDKVVTSEQIIAKQPALNKTGPATNLDDGFLSVTLLMLNEEEVLIIAAFYPTEEQMTAFKPTYLTMLSSIEAAEAA